MKHEDIKKFVEFGFNYDSSLVWIDKINWTCNAEHIKNKFQDAREIGGIYGVMPLFFSMLDEHNQQALLNYIDNQNVLNYIEHMLNV
jgi:hypothetical protein